MCDGERVCTIGSTTRNLRLLVTLATAAAFATTRTFLGFVLVLSVLVASLELALQALKRLAEGFRRTNGTTKHSDWQGSHNRSSATLCKWCNGADQYDLHASSHATRSYSPRRLRARAFP